jgi:hypothetical protein
MDGDLEHDSPWRSVRDDRIVGPRVSEAFGKAKDYSTL